MPAAVIPALIAAGGSIGASAIGSHFAGKAQQNQLDAAGRAVAKNQAEGGSLLNQGQSNTGAAAGYYKSLMGGRTAAQGAVAPAASNITKAFTGAQTGLDRGFLRGGEKDKASADLNRDKTNQISRLYAGVQPGAAKGLAEIGAGQTQQGTGLFAGAPDQMNRQVNTGISLADQQSKQGGAYGNLMFRVLSGLNFGGGPKPAAQPQIVGGGLPEGWGG